MKRSTKNKIASMTLYITPYVITLVGFGGYILKTIDGEFLANKRYDDLKSEVVSEEEFIEVIDEEPVVDESSEIEIINGTSYSPETNYEETIKETYSSDLLDSGYEFENIDFDLLKEENADSTAWIKIDGTNIDYPVVQGEDNDYYLHHDFYKKDSDQGTIFIDSKVNSFADETLNTYTVMYGHRRKDQSMFTALKYYTDQNFYDNNKFGVIYTPDGYAYKAEIFACDIIDANNPIMVDTTQSDEEIFNEYMEKIKNNSLIETNVDVEYGDNILILTTCSYESNNSRCCVYTKLTKEYTNYNQINNKVK